MSNFPASPSCCTTSSCAACCTTSLDAFSLHLWALGCLSTSATSATTLVVASSLASASGSASNWAGSNLASKSACNPGLFASGCTPLPASTRLIGSHTSVSVDSATA
eukprot:TRINITY_DN14127_c0_g2_i1.p3 TRINITY_DN14127_c0_g2~~TRINITY_DN14127_c0_g2_i1.p3  ORF type:complete len:107 (-),score=13.85 TRINITY_DN14127_c0_g2_i1:405-725(-)